jgi:hypothetical protein
MTQIYLNFLPTEGFLTLPFLHTCALTLYLPHTHTHTHSLTLTTISHSVHHPLPLPLPHCLTYALGGVIGGILLGAVVGAAVTVIGAMTCLWQVILLELTLLLYSTLFYSISLYLF